MLSLDSYQNHSRLVRENKSSLRHHGTCCLLKSTLPKTNSSHLAGGLPKRKLIFQPQCLRCELLVSGRVIYILESRTIHAFHTSPFPSMLQLGSARRGWTKSTTKCTWKHHKTPRVPSPKTCFPSFFVVWSEGTAVWIADGGSIRLVNGYNNYMIWLVFVPDG